MQDTIDRQKRRIEEMDDIIRLCNHAFMYHAKWCGFNKEAGGDPTSIKAFRAVEGFVARNPKRRST